MIIYRSIKHYPQLPPKYKLAELKDGDHIQVLVNQSPLLTIFPYIIEIFDCSATASHWWRITNKVSKKYRLNFKVYCRYGKMSVVITEWNGKAIREIPFQDGMRISRKFEPKL